MFDSGILQMLKLIFSKTWELFQIDFPGTSVPISTIMIGGLVFVLGLRIIGLITGLYGNGGMNQGGGNNRNIKIDEKRQGDQR